MQVRCKVQSRNKAPVRQFHNKNQCRIQTISEVPTILEAERVRLASAAPDMAQTVPAVTVVVRQALERVPYLDRIYFRLVLVGSLAACFIHWADIMDTVITRSHCLVCYLISSSSGLSGVLSEECSDRMENEQHENSV